MQKKVCVAISGGVDSSVAAYLLKKKGFAVSLIFGLFLDQRQYPFIYNQISQARELSSILKARLKIIDLRKEFQQKVINYFLNSYKNGLTPNPCVVCNQAIKFQTLFKLAGKHTFFATGHYAKIKKIKNDFFIFKSNDLLKDQSYFLWQIKKDVLPYLIFPLGELTKEKIKEIAQKEKLVKGKIFESKDICFAPEITLFLKNNLPHLAKEGEVLDLNGRIVGKHQGIIFYTIGQRTGFEIDKNKMDKPETLPPLYIKQIKPLKNQIVVGPREYLYQKKIQITNVNFFTFLSKKIKAEVQIRYGYRAEKAEIKQKKEGAEIIFAKSIFAPTPGQSAVIYKKNQLLGGGIIKA